MAQTKYDYQDTRTPITSTGLNSLFQNIQNATNGVDGKIDEQNTRTEAFNRNHFKDGATPNVASFFYDPTPVEWGYNAGLTGTWTTIWNYPIAITVAGNEALRIEWNPMINLSFVQGTASVVVRANSAFYIQFYLTIGGVDTPIAAPFGYNTICAGDGNTGTSDNKTLFYERIPLSTIFMPVGTTFITAVKAKIYFDDGANYKYEIANKYGIVVHHKYQENKMSYTPPFTFVGGSPLLGASLQSNEENLRKYLNVDIIEADIQTDTFSTADIQEGEAFGVTNDFIFATGDIYSGYQAIQTSVPSDRDYHTSTVKRYEPLQKVRWQSIPGLGKQFYMEDNGDALIEISFFAFEDDSDSCRGAVYPWTANIVGQSRNNGQDSQFILAIDGDATVALTQTKGYAFEENGATTITFGQDSIMVGQPGYQGGTTGQRKFIQMMYLAQNLQQGWHQISVLVNACSEKGYVSSRTISVETFYDMGYNPLTKASIATNRKLPETIF